MKPARFDYTRPADLAAATAALADAGAKPIAGGQSLGPMLNLRLARPSLLVDVVRLPDLRGVEEGPGGVLFGAAITHAEFEDGAVPDPTPGFLARIAHGIAYRAVRNRGTIGGSLAHADPAADWPTTLAALGAVVHLAGPEGRRELPVEAFILGAFETALGPGEIITGVFVPRCAAGARFGYRKSCRKLGEFAEAMCAVLSDPACGVHRLVVGATEARQLVVTEAAALIADPAGVEDLLRRAGLAGDPATFRLRRAVIGDAIAALARETTPESLTS
ncbi:FAD binding domain-containing protein [Ancylobacter amanitiformis]|uniref:Carbon-monoxide dehydrogenase medium subunit n=1 Tax=Ancylobacter amanitiformis TaxID=217069 RepID=A0ABU0LN47_9HYPH|nr:FAD binding domain-containing protein [Ancylobacter amanitiformis]MDQ0510115.1 carbon-monoxide dehydrogenase medium subunit [Ancylobacter amanitiformis]